MKQKNIISLQLKDSVKRPFLGGAFLLIPLVLVCFGLSPTVQAGTSLGTGNTSDGAGALHSLTTGIHNTAEGYQALFSDTIGSYNTAIGSQSLKSNTEGARNTATGFQALFFNTTGEDNVANGWRALFHNSGGGNTATGVQALYGNTGDGNTANGFQVLLKNTTGSFNAAVGDQALSNNITGNRNLALGSVALFSLTSGDDNIAVGGGSLIQSAIVNFNTAVGLRALFRCQGDQNVGLGFFAGSNLSGGANNIYLGNVGPVPIGSESNTIRVGTQTATTATGPGLSFPMPAHTATYIAGISGQDATGGDPVFITSDGKLGTVNPPSSARFKDEIKPMDKASEAILALKPVTFRYKKQFDPKGIPQFGLVAEEVEKVNPDLVKRDRDGKLQTVRYEAVNAMLLNEFLKEHRTVQEQQKEIDALRAQLKEQRALIQKVSDKIEMSKPAPQMAVNNQ
jgi:hypothetical protein